MMKIELGNFISIHKEKENKNIETLKSNLYIYI